MPPKKLMLPNADFAPLSGRCVLVARPEVESDLAASDSLSERLAAMGAEIVVQPAIRIGPPADWRPVDDTLSRLGQFDWLVFSSANGVRFLLERLGGKRFDKLVLTSFPKIAAIGPATAEELARFGLKADLVPDRYRAEDLAEALALDAPGRRFLLARASRGREVLAERLAAAGAKVEQIVVYSSTDIERPDPQTAALLAAGRIDWATVTSSSIARSLAALFGENLHRTRLASISPLTSGVLRELGFEPAAEATEYTMSGLAAAIARAS